MATYDYFEFGIFDDRDTAETAVNRLHGLGYQPDEIGVMMSDKTAARDFAHDTGSKVAKGAATGAAIGGGLGAIIAGLTATGSVATIVGTGGAAAPIVAGPLAAALAGLGVGGAAGGILGALVGAGIPEHRAREYQDRLDRGGILLGVRPRIDDRERVRDVLGSEDEPRRNSRN
jgi:Heat induced stress protein YflT